jgi:hypothetical protein
VVFDGTTAGVAGHDLTRELDAPLSAVRRVSTAHLLAMSVTIPITAWAQSVLTAAMAVVLQSSRTARSAERSA